MKAFFKNRFVLAALALIIAATLVFVVAPMLDRQAQKEVTVYIAKEPVSKGSILTENDLKTLSVPAKYLPATAMQDSKNIIGQYAKTDFVPNDYIYPEKLSASPTIQNGWYQDLNTENLAISVTFKSLAAGMSAKLEPDDIISFIAVSNTEATVIPSELKYVRVLSITTDAAQDYDAQAEESALPATVTVLVSPTQATLLASYELNSNLHIALVSRGDDAKATELLELQQDIILTTTATVPDISGTTQSPPNSTAAAGAGEVQDE